MTPAQERNLAIMEAEAIGLAIGLSKEKIAEIVKSIAGGES